MDYDKGHLLHGGISCEGVEAFEGAARESFVGGGEPLRSRLRRVSGLHRKTSLTKWTLIC